MKLITLFIYLILTFSWLYILIFSFKEIAKNKHNSKSLIYILFIILFIDSLRTLIESTYFGTRWASQYGVFPKEVFIFLSNPYLLFIPKIINLFSALTIIFIIIKKWYPEKIKEDNKLKRKYKEEKKDKKLLKTLNKDLDRLVKEKTKELEELNQNLQERVEEEIAKNRIQEQKLFNQSKMASMGEMIGNIAHQWRQPLSTISSLSSGTSLNMSAKVIKEEEVIEKLNQITTTAHHMSQTINDFQDFFKPNKESIKFTLEELVNNTLRIVEPIIKANFIEIKMLKHHSCTLVGPYNEYTQVLMNIFANAKDAFKSKDYENKVIKVILSKEDKYCVIEIVDNAGGIDENIIDKIFNPYFTTKAKTEGTGLGLYMSKEIVEKHMNGKIEVKNVDTEYNNVKRKGVSFKIKLESKIACNI